MPVLGMEVKQEKSVFLKNKPIINYFNGKVSSRALN